MSSFGYRIEIWQSGIQNILGGACYHFRSRDNTHLEASLVKVKDILFKNTDKATMEPKVGHSDRGNRYR